MIFWLSILLSIFCILQTKYSDKGLNRWDILFLLSSWQIFNFGEWETYFSDSVTAPYEISAGMLSLLALWYIYRRGITLGIKFSKSDFLLILKSLVLLSLILIPVGLYVGFLKFNPNLNTKFIICTTFEYILFVGLTEELVFRGILQNLLEKSLKTPYAIIITSGLFAIIYSHITGGSGFPNWTYVSFAFVAGLAYGTAYVKSRSIWVPIIIHGLVDTIWRVILS